eukprot:CAMPEP_0171108780 /NCGR_PEP_ID=MMETSP0766_2-20121228/69589_1 /TAXON_ID=439317 /ORGANISM="Gambierdiscus australes, Strain CAWD 149" /LENGTH=96 /DNA_ID=CAMNT_0011570379 /DNA_START=524 /DNA_END=814 /DNA_ORIENTATION=+
MILKYDVKLTSISFNHSRISSLYFFRVSASTPSHHLSCLEGAADFGGALRARLAASPSLEVSGWPEAVGCPASCQEDSQGGVFAHELLEPLSHQLE